MDNVKNRKGYEIGLPPKNTSLFNKSWYDTKKIFLKLEVFPKKIANSSIKDFANASIGQISIVDAQKEFQEYLNDLGFSDIQPPIYMYVLSESAISETYTNSLENVSLIGKLIESFTSGDSTIAGLYSIASQLRAANFDILDFVKYLNQDIGKLLGTEVIDTGILEKLDALRRISTAEMQGAFQSEYGQTVANVLSNLIRVVLAGNKPIFPKLWVDSNFSGVYNFSIRLYNPNPASEDMHKEYIVKPLAVMLALTLPRAGGSDTNSYHTPLYVSVKCPGLFIIESGMITNLNIIKGGDENAVAFNNRPVFVDVKFSINPLYEKRVLHSLNKQISEKTSLENFLLSLEMKKEQSSGAKVTTGKVAEESPVNTQPIKRVDNEKKNIYSSLRA